MDETQMIIVEGMDNTGKSTLIEALGKEFKIPTARGNMAGAKMDQMVRWINWAGACPKPLILDRHPAISDLVYGNILKGSSESSVEFAQKSREGNFLIYCCPPLESIEKSFSERPQMKGTHENLLALYIAYESLMEKLSPDFYYDWRNPKHLSALIHQLNSPVFTMNV